MITQFVVCLIYKKADPQSILCSLPLGMVRIIDIMPLGMVRIIDMILFVDFGCKPPTLTNRIFNYFFFKTLEHVSISLYYLYFYSYLVRFKFISFLADCIAKADSRSPVGPHHGKPTKEDPYLIKKLIDQPLMSMGQLTIKPEAEKPPQIVDNAATVSLII